MNEIDEIKELHLQRELDHLHLELIEQLGTELLNELVDWSNHTILGPKGGEVKLSIPTFGSPNARVITRMDQPLRPTIEIRLAMLIEIYRDALAFPIASKRIEEETEIIASLNEKFAPLKGGSFIFNEGVPNISEDLISTTLKAHCLTLTEATLKEEGHRIGKKEIYCRFLMFELMLTWTFFHELGHVIQGHPMISYRLSKKGDHSVETCEMDEHSRSEPDIPGQAREVLADAEGLSLTFKYLSQTGRLHYAPFYLLLCAVGCMFQRFYRTYNATLDLTNGQHPHPAIRDDLAQVFATRRITRYLVSSGGVPNAQDAAFPLVYLSTRASLITGACRALRIEKLDGKTLPSYIALFTEPHHKKKELYNARLAAAIEEQAPRIRELYLLSHSRLDMILKCLLHSSVE